MEWPRLLAYITGRVDKELLVRNEYLAAENRILQSKIKGRLQLLDGEKRTLSEIAHRLGRKALAEVAVAAKPDTILRWFRKLVARKFDGSARRHSVGRPRIEKTPFEVGRMELRRGSINFKYGRKWQIHAIRFRRLGEWRGGPFLARLVRYGSTLECHRHTLHRGDIEQCRDAGERAHLQQRQQHRRQSGHLRFAGTRSC